MKTIRTSKKVGLSPGSVVYTGSHVGDRVSLGLIAYDETNLSEKEDISLEAALAAEDTGHVDWLNVNGLHDTRLIQTIGEHFKLHPLTLEDLVSTRQRPKIEVFENYVYIVLRMLSLEPDTGTLRDEQVSLILGDGYVLSFQERDDGDVFDPVRERIRANKGKIRKLGADYLAYALMDVIVDTYFVILEHYAEHLGDIEEELLDEPTPDVLKQLNGYKREMVFLRRSVWPLREVLNTCQRAETELFGKTVLTYLRDVYDHTVQVIDTVETLRDLGASLLDLYLSSLSYKMNEVMKMLTIIATIFIPLTFIVGIYGMNFVYMPELGQRWAYPAVWGIMIAVAAGLIAYFKRKDWL